MNRRLVVRGLACALLCAGSIFWPTSVYAAEGDQISTLAEQDGTTEALALWDETAEKSGDSEENDGEATEKPENPVVPEDEGDDTGGASEDDSSGAKPMTFGIESLPSGGEDAGEGRDSDTSVEPAVTDDETPWQSVYNYRYYRANNSDLQAAFGDDRTAYLNHFKLFGMAEGRQASEAFNPASYRLAYRDLRAAFRSNWRGYYAHYLAYGKNEGRTTTGVSTMQNAVTAAGGVDYSPVYSYQYYHDTYQDLRDAFGEYDDDGMLAHFINFGMKEGRHASASFDPASYRNAYPDLRAAFGKDWTSYYKHYLSYGRREGRNKTHDVASRQGTVTSWRGIDYSPVYDYAYYYANNADLRKAFGDDDAALMQHFVVFGMHEARRGNDAFDPVSYRLEYQDLRGAYGNNWPSYYLHYVRYGRAEGRVTSGVKSLQNPVSQLYGQDWSPIYEFFYYLGHYADIKAAFGGYDDFGVLRHYITFGMHEGRQACENPAKGWQNPSWMYQVSAVTSQVPAGHGIFSYVSPNRIRPDASRTAVVDAFVARAYDYLGTPYVWDYACAPGVGIDCAGLVLQCGYAVGMNFGDMNPYNHYYGGGWHAHYANALWGSGAAQHVAVNQLQKGDLVSYEGHVSVYLGDGTMIEAWPGTGVRRTTLRTRGARGGIRLFS